MRNHFYTLAAFTSAVMVSCISTSQRPETSQIIKKMENAGAGDLSSANSESIEHWLAQRRALIDEIEALCNSRRKIADASWFETSEGRICRAAQNLTFFRYIRQHGDGEAFRAGSQ